MPLGGLNKSPWENYLEGGGLQSEEIIKSTLFCKVHYVLNSDIKNIRGLRIFFFQTVLSEPRCGETLRDLDAGSGPTKNIPRNES
jgi:hypothetical protein